MTREGGSVWSDDDDDYSDLYHNHTLREKMLLAEKIVFPSRDPDRVILNLTENPETSIAMNWRTDTTVSSGTVQWAVSTAGPEFLDNVSSVLANREVLKVNQEGEPAIIANYFSARVENLTPGQKYVYRVGSTGSWTAWYQFQMPDPKRKLSFVYFGDAQNDIKSLWSRVIRQAYMLVPDADFMLYAGDLVNRFNSNVEWGEWFYAGDFIHATIPSVMTPGNHEYGEGVVLSSFWRNQFNLPTNGPRGLEETCYAVNYSNLKVISLDSQQIDESAMYLEEQEKWLDSILTYDPRKWTAITFHFQMFSAKAKNRDHENLTKYFKPLFDKHKVDIIMQGHDHAYGRGMVSGSPTGKHKESESGTVYVVSVSGPKMYDITDKPWLQRKARNTQLFQVISIRENTLEYKAYTANGDVYDAFDLIKSDDKPNRLVERTPGIPERF